MRFARKLAGILLLTVIAGYPAMACLVSAAEMTDVERECCKHMEHQCGSTDMPASHSCCQTEVRQPHPMLQAAAAQVAPPVATEVPAIHLENPYTSFAEFSIFQLHPTPESPPGSASILRI